MSIVALSVHPVMNLHYQMHYRRDVLECEENIYHRTAFILPNVRARRENYTLTKDPKQLL